MSATPAPLAGLSGTLHSQFTDWLDRRKPQEEKMLRWYADNMRIWRDDDTKESGTSKAQKSKVFMGSTRSKIRSARAKIKDNLFGIGQLPFDTRPSNEDLKEFSDTMEAILTQQFTEGKWKAALGTGIDAISTYGTGFMFGPFVRKKAHTSVSRGATGGLEEQSHEYDCPYYEHGRTMDTYPDPDAEDVQAGRGVYWASRKSPEFVRSLKGKPGYSDAALDRALNEKVTSYTDQGSDRTDQMRMNLYRYTKEGRIWFVRFFGLVKAREFEAWRKDAGLQEQPAEAGGNDASASSYESEIEERVEAVVLMAGGQVIKAELNPYKAQRRPVQRCVYEDVEHEMWGVGIAENNDPNQRVINAAFRLYIEGKAFALLKMCSVDRSKFEVTEDFKFFPGKRFAMKPGLTPEERKESIIWHDMVDVTTGWEKVIALSEQFSDDDTAITKYTQGNDASHLNDTATGISMIMNASSMPLKEVLGNVDSMWIEPQVEALIDWDLENLEPETVRLLVGEKEAAVWAKIKAYGKANFMEWFATGAQTFMAKEILMHKLQGFAQLVGSNEQFQQLVDAREMLEQIWDAGQIGKESPVLSEDDMNKKQSQGPMQQAQGAIQEVEQQAQKLIQQAQEQARQAVQARDEAVKNEQLKLAELAAKEREAEREDRRQAYAQHDQIIGTLAGLHKTQADTDLVQAQAAKTLVEAGLTPSGELIQEAEGAESEGDETEPEASPKRGKKKLNPVSELVNMNTQLAERMGQTLDLHGKTLESLNSLTAEMKRPKKIKRDGSGRVAGIE